MTEDTVDFKFVHALDVDLSIWRACAALCAVRAANEESNGFRLCDHHRFGLRIGFDLGPLFLLSQNRMRRPIRA